MTSAFALSDHQSTLASSSQARSELSAGEFYGQPVLGQRQMRHTAAKQVSELPKQLANELSAEELDICKQVEVLAFDQAGCRMIQKKLEEKSADHADVSSFAAALVHLTLDILPEIMTNQFGNYLCQKLIEVAPASSLK